MPSHALVLDYVDLSPVTSVPVELPCADEDCDGFHDSDPGPAQPWQNALNDDELAELEAHLDEKHAVNLAFQMGEVA